MSKRLSPLLLLVVVAVVVAGCGEPVGTAAPRDLAGRELRLVATTGMVGDLVSTVAGEPLYAACGFTMVERIDIPTSRGVTVPCARMAKPLAGGDREPLGRIGQ